MSAKAQLYELLARLMAERHAPYLSYAAIRAAVREAGLPIADSTLKQYLNEALKKQIVFNAGRGWYGGLSEPLKLDTTPVAKLIRELKKAFPLVEFTAWNTLQVNPWMHHLLAHGVAFVHVPYEALMPVGEHLEAEGWNVLVDPLPKEGAKRLRPSARMVVLREMLQCRPPPHGKQAAPEQVLVDLLLESQHLPIMDPHEARDTIQRIMETFLVQMAVVHRYAASRGVEAAFVDGTNQRQ
ncbi:MAG TPA: hypothetical protein PKD45_14935 [Flavobacteriales bacterium]|nr:hypothetical protein [Flavobacteriales bacterium]